MKEMVGGCCVCSDDRGWSENPLVYCDGQSCTVAVHQACYGIVTVPTGPWYCRKCESQERSVKVKCELCPSKYGALKRTDNNGWAHVVCALYIPEVRFGNVTTMEPIQLQLIPAERFTKTCYICEEKGKPGNSTVGACMQCNKSGCKQQFHVTCAQSLGLLCEEAGNYFDNVKYCGYCQHHYSKLKKGGNVKTIPPYKPVSNEAHNSDSNSEKEPETTTTAKNSTQTNSKKRSSAGGKTSQPKNQTKSSNSQSSKTVHNSKNTDKSNKVSNSRNSAKSEESVAVGAEDSKKETNKSDINESERDAKSSGGSSKKRKANSRTPTPISSGVVSEVSVVVSPVSISGTAIATSTISNIASDKKTLTVADNSDKSKKPKVDPNHSIVVSQPVVALTSISTLKVSSPTVVDTALAPEAPAQPTQIQIPSQSLVVSVPLVNTTLSPHPHGNNQIVVGVVPPSVPQERSNSAGSSERMSVISGEVMTAGSANLAVLPSEISGASAASKIGYEKPPDSINTEEDMELELDPSPSTIVEEPITRARIPPPQSVNERPGRGKKRNSAGPMLASTTSLPSTSNQTPTTTQKRSSRSQHVSPDRPGAFAAVSQTIPVKEIKESPPPSPTPEPPTTSSGRGRPKGRKSAPASINSNSKDTKDVKLFQNGLTAPHMLGNQLNPSSHMHSKMTDHLNSELEAHSIFNPNEGNSNLIGPPLQHKVVQQARASSTGGSSTASGSSGLSTMLGGGGGNIPQTLDQLLERQWEQGSQFLMEQAQHFDIASLLSCLHQLRAENMRLEEHVNSLLQRRDHLLAVNARLAIPLTGQPTVNQIPTTNNIHPSVAATHEDIPRPHQRTGSMSRYSGHNQAPDQAGVNASAIPVAAAHDDLSRSSRSSSSSRYGSSVQHPGMDNGLPEGYPQAVVGTGQPSPTVRHSPVGAFQNNNLHRQNSDAGSRSASRSQSYQVYDRPGTSSQQQMVIRERSDRDTEVHQLSTTKPS